MKNSTKTAKSAKSAKTVAVNYKIHSAAFFAPVPAEKREETNWNAKVYRDREQSFYASASYEAPSAAVVVPLKKKALKATIKAGLEAAKKVRHNNTKKEITIAKFAIIDGVPHKRVNGQFVPLTPAAESKKWDVIG